MNARERDDLERILLSTEQVEGCAYGGLGCLGEHDDYDDMDETEGRPFLARPCEPVQITVTTCLCGASDAYGEMWHEDRCPLKEPS